MLGLMVRLGYNIEVSRELNLMAVGPTAAVARDISASCLRPLRSVSVGWAGGEGG